MSRKSLFGLTIVMIALMIIPVGCRPEQIDETPVSASIELKFEEGVGSYKSVIETIQDYKFEQPSIEKVKEEQNKTKISITFDQEITSVKEDGTAEAKITITDAAIYMKDRDGVKLDFDSSRESDKSKPMTALIGKSYTVDITPDGKAKALDTKAVRNAVRGGLSARIAKNLFSDDEIAKRHSIISMPQKDSAVVTKGKPYSKIVSSHPRAIEAKSFEKQYELESIDEDGLARIKMSAVPSDQPVESGPGQGGFGFMAKMFDANESYEGEMDFNIETGQLVSMSEKFAAAYVATDNNKKFEEGKGPDTLTMGLTYIISLEKLN